MTDPEEISNNFVFPRDLMFPTNQLMAYSPCLVEWKKRWKSYTTGTKREWSVEHKNRREFCTEAAYFWRKVNIICIVMKPQSQQIFITYMIIFDYRTMLDLKSSISFWLQRIAAEQTNQIILIIFTPSK